MAKEPTRNLPGGNQGSTINTTMSMQVTATAIRMNHHGGEGTGAAEDISGGAVMSRRRKGTEMATKRVPDGVMSGVVEKRMTNESLWI